MVVFALLLATLTVFGADLPDAGSLVRVEIPGWPGALASSEVGSVLESPPPAGTPWRYEGVAEVDAFIATEAVEALQVSAWHEAGFDGTGVRVAVFDPQWLGAEAQGDELGEFLLHDCFAHDACTPMHDTFRPQFASEAGVHGVACAEVIRDLAPGVELNLVRVSTSTTLENAAAWAVREGIDVVSMSLSFYNESFYDGTGPVSDVVPVMAAGGALMVKSAGNSAEEHWKGRFTDDDLDGWNEFPGSGESLPIWFEEDGQVYVNWDQYRTCGDTDLDIYLVDQDGLVLGRSEDRQDVAADRCSPLERMGSTIPRADWYYLQVRRAAGDPAVDLAVFTRGGEVWHGHRAGSVTDPGNHPLAFTVGAVRANGYLFNDTESFSSEGPTAAGWPKPDIAGPDGLSTAAYGSVSFYGTSASTPAVAALVALVMSRYPELDAYEAAEVLRSWAVSDRDTWEEPDMARGAGYARLPPLEAGARGCADRLMILPVLCWLPLVPLRRRCRESPP